MTSAEKQIEFICGAHNRTPVTPLDGRFLGTTAQLFASSSHGTLRVLLKTWAYQRIGRRLTQVLDPANEPVFNVLNDWKRGLQLGAGIHRAEYEGLAATGLACDPCTTDQWIDLWNAIFRSYNPGGNGYSATPRIEIIQTGDLADWAGTIPYEILTGFNERVPRIYRGAAASQEIG